MLTATGSPIKQTKIQKRSVEEYNRLQITHDNYAMAIAHMGQTLSSGMKDLHLKRVVSWVVYLGHAAPGTWRKMSGKCAVPPQR